MRRTESDVTAFAAGTEVREITDAEATLSEYAWLEKPDPDAGPGVRDPELIVAAAANVRDIGATPTKRDALESV